MRQWQKWSHNFTMVTPLNSNSHTTDTLTDDGKTRPAQDNSPDINKGVLTVGWREWVSLPGLGLPGIKAKVDTGARTSSIHAFDIKPFSHSDGTDWVAFSVLPIQRQPSIVRHCKAPLVDLRSVTDSGGHAEQRFCVSTQLIVGPVTRTVEITLAQRNDMLFRMLLGRTTLKPDIVVNPHLSYTLGRKNARSLYNDQDTDAGK